LSEVTRILSAIEEGDPHAAQQLLLFVYDELRRLAAAQLARESRRKRSTQTRSSMRRTCDSVKRCIRPRTTRSGCGVAWSSAAFPPPDPRPTRHRVCCGDSSKPEDVDKLLDGAPIHLVNTDPPYNVRVEPRSNNAIAAGLSSFEATGHRQENAAPRKLRAKDRPLANDYVSDEEFQRPVR
jgi:hypothetical protein